MIFLNGEAFTKVILKPLLKFHILSCVLISCALLIYTGQVRLPINYWPTVYYLLILLFLSHLDTLSIGFRINIALLNRLLLLHLLLVLLKELQKLLGLVYWHLGLLEAIHVVRLVF